MNPKTIVSLFIGVAVIALVQEGNPQQRSSAVYAEEILSRTLRDLKIAVANGKVAAVENFWTTLEESGAPLIEPVSLPDYRLVTFIYRGGEAIGSVRLDSGLNALLVKSIRDDDQKLGLFRRLEGTDVWYLSMVLSTKLRAPYRFALKRLSGSQEERALDQLNPRVFAHGTPWARSLLVLHNAPPQPWRALKAQGLWHEITINSSALGGARKLIVYLPPNYRSERREPYAVLLGMDSYGFRNPLLPADQILDFLVSQRKIPETVIVLTEDVGRIGDTSGYGPVVDFLADEVLPTARKTINISNKPQDIVICGSSRRGLVASYVAFKRPDTIAKVLSLSGSFYWRPSESESFEWLPNLYAFTERKPIRLYLAAGELETFVTDTNSGHYLLGTNRHMRNILAARGYDYQYVEFMGVHSEVNWEDQLAAGLTWLWSKQ